MKPLCIVSCPIDTFSGYGARARDLVKSLIQLKDEEWDIKILPQRWGDTPWGFYSPDDPIRKRFIPKLTQQPDIWFQITVPNEFHPIGRFNIGVTAGIETTVFPGEFLEGMNKMNLNLVSSEHSKKVAESTAFDKMDNNTKQKVSSLKLNQPVETLFEGLDTNVYFKDPSDSGLLKGISEDFVFLYTGHWLNGDIGEDRKNTGLMIKTFLETFNTPSKSKPALVLKTCRVNSSILDRKYITEKILYIKEKVQKQSGGTLPNIYLLHGEMTDEEMNKLNNDPKVKAFVSFTKGEGFGRPLLEASITGKPILVSAWSGHLDFLKPDYNILIGGELTNVHKSSSNKFLLEESQWFSINPDVASRAMKDVFKHYKTYLEQTRKQTKYIKDNFTLDNMTKKLGSLLPKVEPKPQTQQLQLPKLKKTDKGDNGIKPPTLQLPKLKKIEA